jgi:phage FluMu protein Com
MNVLYPNSLDDAYGWKIHLEVACPKCKSDEFKKEVDEYPYMNAEQKKFLLEKYGKPEVL